MPIGVVAAGIASNDTPKFGVIPDPLLYSDSGKFHHDHKLQRNSTVTVT